MTSPGHCEVRKGRSHPCTPHACGARAPPRSGSRSCCARAHPSWCSRSCSCTCSPAASPKPVRRVKRLLVAISLCEQPKACVLVKVSQHVRKAATHMTALYSRNRNCTGMCVRVSSSAVCVSSCLLTTIDVGDSEEMGPIMLVTQYPLSSCSGDWEGPT